MGFTKKTWKNRIAEYINRRRLTMEDGSTSLVTVARDEGTISQEGDAFNAVNMNDLEDRIEAGFADVTQSLTNIGVEEYLGSTISKGWAMVEVTNLNKYKSIRIYATSIDNTNNRLGMNEIPVSVLINGGSVQFRGALNISKLIDVECKYNNSTLNIYSDGNTRAAVYGIY